MYVYKLFMRVYLMATGTFTPGDIPKKTKGDDLSDLKSKETFPLVIRASDGNKSKISTFVTQEGLDEFFAKYSEVCKSGMGALKKRDRKKEKAKKEKKK